MATSHELYGDAYHDAAVSLIGIGSLPQRVASTDVPPGTPPERFGRYVLHSGRWVASWLLIAALVPVGLLHLQWWAVSVRRWRAARRERRDGEQLRAPLLGEGTTTAA